MSLVTLTTPVVSDAEMQFVDQVLSAEDAARLLKEWQYERQRPVRAGVVATYAKQMEEGHWRYSVLRVGVVQGRSVYKDTTTGQEVLGEKRDQFFLIDGQHRLHALARSGKHINFGILYQRFPTLDALYHEYSVIDTGAKRLDVDRQKALGVIDDLAIDLPLLKGINNAAKLIASDFESNSPKPEALERYGVFGPEARALLPLAWRREIKIIQNNLQSTPGGVMRQAWRRGAVLGVALVALRYGGEAFAELLRSAMADDSLTKDTHAYVLNRQVTVNLRGNPDDPAVSRSVAGVWNSLHRNDLYARTPHVNREGQIAIAGTPWNGKGTTERQLIQRFQFFGIDIEKEGGVG